MVELIEKATQNIRKQCKITTPLCDYDSLVREMGARVEVDYRIPYDKEGAACKTDKNDLVLCLARSTIGWPRNMALCNLLGLSILFMGYELSDTIWGKVVIGKYHYPTPKQMKYIEIFTHSLIAPRDEFEFHYDKLPDTKSRVENMMGKFSVPHNFIKKRAQQLGLIMV